jgi:CheY-like chemotaxis protein/rubrerythrin
MLLSEILAWLHPIEEEARVAYAAAANCIPTNPSLTALLKRLSEDELGHQKLLSHAQQLLAEAGADRPASIRADEAAREQIVTPLRELQMQARANTLTEANTIHAIVQAEFSEWNNIFLYVLTQFRDQAPVFQHVAAVIQQHEQRIEDFLAQLPTEQATAASLQLPPKVWDRQILLVDDEEGLRMALKMCLKRFGQVTVASNGQEALEHTRRQFFDVIVSDVDMPVMNGLDFFEALAGDNSPGRKRFIFCTASEREDLEKLQTQGRVKILKKPFDLSDVQQAVRAILDKPE